MGGGRQQGERVPPECKRRKWRELRLPKQCPQNVQDMTEIYLQSGCTMEIIKSEDSVSQSEWVDKETREKEEPPPIILRIANGGGGQTGLVEALARSYLSSKRPTVDGMPAAIAWRASNTNGSLQGLYDGTVDIAIVYEIEREMEALLGSGPRGR
jgi:hypothetical protein